MKVDLTIRRFRNQSMFAWLIFIWLFSSCAQKPTMEDLRKNIIEEFSKVDGDFAIAFKDISTGETLLVNEKEVFHAASTMKTPVMIEVFKQASAGNISLDDSVTVSLPTVGCE